MVPHSSMAELSNPSCGQRILVRFQVGTRSTIERPDMSKVPFVRSSEITAFKRCPARWWWGWREGLRPRSEQLGPLWFGTGVHIALAEWYCGPGMKRGVEPAESWADFSAGALAYMKTADLTEESLAKYETAASLGTAMLEGYRALYGLDDHIDVIQPERTFTLDLPWPKQGIWEQPSGPMAILAGTFDLVYRDLRTGKVWLKEHKTARAVSTGHLPLDEQAGKYWAVANTVLQREGILGSKEFIAGILYNFLRKGLPDDRPQDSDGYYCNKPLKADYLAALNADDSGLDSVVSPKATLAQMVSVAEQIGLTVLGERSKIQPQPLFVRHHVHRTSPERRAQLLRAQNDVMAMELYRDGVLPITKVPTYDCHRFCQFFSICELQERGGDWESLRDVAFRTEDPYADHRKSTDE